MIRFLKQTVLRAVRAAGYEIIKLGAAPVAPAASPTAPLPSDPPPDAPMREPPVVPLPPPVPFVPPKTLIDRWMDRTMMIAGVQAVREQRKLERINSLADVEVCVF